MLKFFIIISLFLIPLYAFTSEETPVPDVWWTYSTGGPINAPPLMADVDSDGKLEVIVASEDNSIYILRATTGSLLWKFSAKGPLLGPPVIGDLDKDGDLDIVFGCRGDFIYALEGKEGKLLWKYLCGGAMVSAPVLSDRF